MFLQRDFEHLVFVITAVMQFLIPDIPTELKTQIQREQLLAKEAKFQNGADREPEYEELLTAIRDTNKKGLKIDYNLNKRRIF
jgi:anoctamin-4